MVNKLSMGGPRCFGGIYLVDRSVCDEKFS